MKTAQGNRFKMNFTTEYTEYTEKSNCPETFQHLLICFGGGIMFIQKAMGDFSTQALEL